MVLVMKKTVLEYINVFILSQSSHTKEKNKKETLYAERATGEVNSPLPLCFRWVGNRDPLELYFTA